MKKTFVPNQLVPSVARSTSGTSNVANVSRAQDFVFVTFDVSAISGTGARVGFVVEFAEDGAASRWFSAKDVVRTTAVGKLATRIPTFGPYLRVRWEILGTTPSVTFTVNLAWRE